MARLPDWEQRLADFVAGNADRPFEWGAWDCILMACAAVEAMTGVDPAAEYRGRYSDAKGAARALRELGQGTLARTVDAEFEACPVGKAGRGDLVLVDGSIGICMGGFGLFVGEVEDGDGIAPGLIRIPRNDFEAAWKV